MDKSEPDQHPQRRAGEMAAQLPNVPLADALSLLPPALDQQPWR
jgi:hypothetical protein